VNWEPYEAVTRDGWTLTVFRVFKDIDESHSPIVLHPGDGMLPEDWSASWVIDLAKNGYDIWLCSWRGMKNADKNSKDGTWSGQERWAFSYTETGTIDIPA